MPRPSRTSIAILILFLAVLFTTDLYAHSGGTDANGGHYNRKTGEYHSHSSRKPKSRQTKAWTGKVVGVSDGDTIKVLRAGQQVKIRLYGVDTPRRNRRSGKPQNASQRRWWRARWLMSNPSIQTATGALWGL